MSQTIQNREKILIEMFYDVRYFMTKSSKILVSKIPYVASRTIGTLALGHIRSAAAIVSFFETVFLSKSLTSSWVIFKSPSKSFALNMKENYRFFFVYFHDGVIIFHI